MRILLLSLLIFNFSPSFAQELLPPEPQTEAVPPGPVKREPARIPSAAEAEAIRAESRSHSGLGFFIGADADLGRNINFSSVSLTDGGTTYGGTASINTTVAVGIRAGLEMMPAYGLGFQASIAIETPRVVSAINSNIANTSTNNNVNTNATLQFNLIEANLIFRWDQFYIPAGINYSIPVASNFGISTASYSFNGFIGGQAGVGGIFYGGLHVEALIYLIDMQMRAGGTDASAVAYTENFNTGILPSLNLRAHWTF